MLVFWRILPKTTHKFDEHGLKIRFYGASRGKSPLRNGKRLFAASLSEAEANHQSDKEVIP